jgi:hypothetical protein
MMNKTMTGRAHVAHWSRDEQDVMDSIEDNIAIGAFKMNEYDYYDDFASDIDETPMDLPVRCTVCGKVEVHHIVAESFDDYSPNLDGTYTSIQGECNDCLIGE